MNTLGLCKASSRIRRIAGSCSNSQELDFNWAGECFFQRPSPVKPIAHRIIRNPQSLADFDKASSEAPKCHDPITSLISSLFFTRGPFAVARLVAFRVVLALNGKPWRFFSHIGQKIRKRLPALTDRDTASSIIFEICAFGVGATSNHIQPHFIDRCGVTASCVAVCSTTISQKLAVKTSTGTSGSGYQITILNFFLIPAIAQTQATPFELSRWHPSGGSISDDGKSCETATDEGCFGGHRIGSFNFVSNGGRSASTGARCVYSPVSPLESQPL